MAQVTNKISESLQHMVGDKTMTKAKSHSDLQAARNLRHMAKDKPNASHQKNQGILEQNTLQTSVHTHFFSPIRSRHRRGEKRRRKMAENGSSPLR
ncbi:unnamed protein product [Prunus brigantina]